MAPELELTRPCYGPNHPPRPPTPNPSVSHLEETRHFPTCIECPAVRWSDSRENLIESAQLVHKSFAYSPWIIDICCQIEDFFFLLYVSCWFSVRQWPERICSVQSEWDWLCGKMSALSHFFPHMYNMWKMSHSLNVRKKLAWFDTHVHIVSSWVPLWALSLCFLVYFCRCSSRESHVRCFLGLCFCVTCMNVWKPSWERRTGPQFCSVRH